MAASREPSLDHLLLWVRLIDRVSVILINLTKWAAWVWIASFVPATVEHLAGERTDAKISVLISFLADTGEGKLVVLSFGIGVMGVFYGIRERHLHHRAIRSFQKQIREMQTIIDPQRSSSGLGPEGDSNPDDI
jgi:hypothetical protein